MAVDESVKVVINAEDRASGVLANVGKGLGGLGGAFAAFGTVALTALTTATGAVTAFALSSLREFQAAERDAVISTNNLHQAFDNLSKQDVVKLKQELGTSTVAFKQIEDAMYAAGKAALKLGYDDDTARAAFSKLFGATHDVTQAQKDLALAEDLAANKGIPLAEAADAIARVHAGAARVLATYGVAVKDLNSPEEALAALHEKVGGTAEAMANTTSGKLMQLSENWNNLKETVGNALATAITPFIDKLTLWAQDPRTQAQFAAIAQKVAQFALQLTPVAQALIPAMITGLNITISVLEFLGKSFNATTNFLGTLIFKVMEFVDWVGKMIEQVKQAVEWLDRLAQRTIGGIKSTVSGIGNAIGNIFRAEGGPVSAGSAYIVGERGPELFVPNTGGNIVPGKIGGGIIINITGTFLSQNVAEQLGGMLIDQLKSELRI